MFLFSPVKSAFTLPLCQRTKGSTYIMTSLSIRAAPSVIGFWMSVRLTSARRKCSEAGIVCLPSPTTMDPRIHFILLALLWLRLQQQQQELQSQYARLVQVKQIHVLSGESDVTSCTWADTSCIWSDSSDLPKTCFHTTQ